MIYNSISAYIEANQEWQNTRWRVNEFGSFAFVNGNWISEEKFNELYTKPVFEPPALINPDGTTIYSGIASQHKRR